MFAQPSLKENFIKKTLHLDKIMAWALTEPDTGSDAANIKSTAKKVSGGYLLNGRKRWIGNATFCDYIAVWAKNTNENDAVQCFLVRKGVKGLKTSKIENKMSLRAV